MSQKPATTPTPQQPVQNIQPQVKHTPASPQQYKTTPAPGPATQTSPGASESLRPVRVNTPKRQDNPSTPGKPAAGNNPPTPLPASPATPIPATPAPAGSNGNGATPPAKDLSLTKRYLADQYNQKQPSQSPTQAPLTPLPPTARPAGTAMPEPPTVVKPPATPGLLTSNNGQARHNGNGMQNRAATPPVSPMSPTSVPPPTTPSSFAPFSPQPSPMPSPFGPAGQLAPPPQAYPFQGLRNGRPSSMTWDIPADTPDNDPLDGIFRPAGTSMESINATSKAAERWRKSWRDRQRAEAAPAVGVSRGQARVPEPLLVMQHSIIRMRAIIMPKQQAQKQKKGSKRFGLTLLTLLVLLGTTLAYVAYSYLPTNAAHTVTNPTPAKVGSAPVLTVPTGKTTAVSPGQTLKIHGDYFAPQDTVTFILDTTPINASSPVRINQHGAFDASFIIDTTWLPGSYALMAQDSQTGQHAMLSVQILPAANTPNNTSLQLTTQDDQPLPSLSFSGVAGLTNPAGQRIKLVNNSDTAGLSWTASEVTTTDVNWLLINDSKMSGTLDTAGSDSIGISVQTSGLVGSTKPYQGYVIFNVDKQGLVVLAVTLQLHFHNVEVVITPNPIIALLKPATQGQCQDTSFTLVNLSDQIVFWDAKPFQNDQQYIHLNGQPTASSQMQPSGQAGDTAVITLTCTNVHLGDKLYNITVNYNRDSGGGFQNVPVSIRTSF